MNPLWTFTEIFEATNGNDVSNKFLNSDKKIFGVSIDERTLKRGDLFIAIKGKKFDGHNYIQSAFNKGASGVIVSNISDANDFGGLLVKNTQKALFNIAKYSRKRFNGKVIAITGSNGKTSTKFIAGSCLNLYGKTHITADNNNNLLGVSLTLSRLNQNN